MTLRSQPSEGCASASFATSAHRLRRQYSGGARVAQCYFAAIHAGGSSGLMRIFVRWVSTKTKSAGLLVVT